MIRVGFYYRQAQLTVVGLVIGGWVMMTPAVHPVYHDTGVVAGSVMATEATPAPTPSPTLVPTPTPLPAVARPARTPRAPSPVGALVGRPLYVEPAPGGWLPAVATQPRARWLGDWIPQPAAEVSRLVGAAAAAGMMPVLVAYNLPGRDCGGYSAGGAGSVAAYQAWIEQVAVGIGTRAATVIVEPDALAELDCFGADQRNQALSLLKGAVDRLKANPATVVYLDAGNARWRPAATMAPRLAAAGLAAADGFSLNVSNFYTTDESVRYGNELSGLTGGKHYVVDTSRNGAGSDGNWCNPAGRALGAVPTTRTGVPLADAWLWIKTPGESDGTCNGGPAAGQWWPEYAAGLAARAGR